MKTALNVQPVVGIGSKNIQLDCPVKGSLKSISILEPLRAFWAGTRNFSGLYA